VAVIALVARTSASSGWFRFRAVANMEEPPAGTSAAMAWLRLRAVASMELVARAWASRGTAGAPLVAAGLRASIAPIDVERVLDVYVAVTRAVVVWGA